MRLRFMSGIAVSSALLFLAIPAQAVTVGEFQKWPEGTQRSFIIGMYSGLVLMGLKGDNVKARTSIRGCLTGKGGDAQIFPLFKTWIQTNKVSDDVVVELVFARQLLSACPIPDDVSEEPAEAPAPILGGDK